MTCSIESIGIIGYGRFGALIHQLLQERLPDTRFSIHSNSQSRECSDYSSLEEACSAQIVVPCVPIKNFEETIARIAPLLAERSIVIDVCSVKIHPKEVLLRLLPEGKSILSHPMFGPGTYQKRLETNPDNPLSGLTVVIDTLQASESRYRPILDFLESFALNVVEMDADQHDKLAARFQFVCLTTAFILKELQISRSNIDTESASLMMDYLEMISVDPQLVKDLYTYNPYCKKELKTFGSAFNSFVTFLEEGD